VKSVSVKFLVQIMSVKFKMWMNLYEFLSLTSFNSTHKPVFPYNVYCDSNMFQNPSVVNYVIYFKSLIIRNLSCIP
jgi:hypothetical protein